MNNDNFDITQAIIHNNDNIIEEPKILHERYINLLIKKASGDSINNKTRCKLWRQIMQEKINYLTKYHKSSIPDVPSSDGRFHAYVPHEGKRKSIAAKTRDELIDKLYNYYDTSESLTFKELFDRWVNYQENDMSRSCKSIGKYKSDYLRFVGDSDFASMDITEITETDITKLLIANASGSKYGEEAKYHQLKAKTVANFAGNIKKSFDYAVRNKFIAENPMKYVDMALIKQKCDRTQKPDEDKIFSDSEFEAIKKDLHGRQADKPHYLSYFACEFVMMTGARVGEVSALKWDSIDFKNGFILFQRTDIAVKLPGNEIVYETQERTKTGKSRRFILFDELKELLIKVRDIQYKLNYPDEYVFSNADGKVSPGSIAVMFRRSCGRAGCEIGSIHAMRKTVSSRLLTMGFSPVSVAAMLGHSVKVNREHYAMDVTSDIQKMKGFEMQYNARINDASSIADIRRDTGGNTETEKTGEVMSEELQTLREAYEELKRNYDAQQKNYNEMIPMLSKLLRNTSKAAV